MSIKIEPIPPSQVVDAINSAGASVAEASKTISEPFAVYLIIIAGIMIVVGLLFSALGITKRLLSAGLLTLVGVVVMFVFLNQPVEIMGLIKGLIDGLFGSIKRGG